MKFRLDQRLADILFHVVVAFLEMRFRRLTNAGPMFVQNLSAGIGAQGRIVPARVPGGNPFRFMHRARVDVLEAEIEPQTARDDCRQKHRGTARGEEDQRVRRRFLERLEESVGRAGAQGQWLKCGIPVPARTGETLRIFGPAFAHTWKPRNGSGSERKSFGAKFG